MWICRFYAGCVGVEGLKIKIYDWKKLLVSVLIGGIELAYALARLFRGRISELLWVFIIGSLVCRGVYAPLS